ncbi:hypothetical protein [Streptomyces mirabilis]
MAWMILVVCTLAGATALTWIEFKLRRQRRRAAQEYVVQRSASSVGVLIPGREVHAPG